MVLNKDYFARYGEHVASGCSSKLAWEKTEKELFKMYGCRKYRTFGAFKTCFGYFRRRNKEMRKIVLHIVDNFEI